MKPPVMQGRNEFRIGFNIPWLAWGLLLFTLGLYNIFTTPQITPDEAWFLQVLQRVISGDVLYRDVFFGVTPLSLFLLAVPAWLLGVELWILRAVQVVCFAGMGVLGIRIGEQLNLERAFPYTLSLAMLAYAQPNNIGASTPYAPLSYVFLLGCFASFLAYTMNRKSPTLAIASFSASLSFACKQTTGLLGLLALLIAYTINQRGPWKVRRFFTGVGFVLGVFTLTTFLLVLVPVLAKESFPQFLEYGFLNKATYLQFANITLFSQLEGLLELVRQPWGIVNLGAILSQAQFVLPFLAIGLLIWAGVHPGADRRRVLTVACFSGAALAGVYPRIDTRHLGCVIPSLWIAISFAWQNLKPKNSPGWFHLPAVFVILWIVLGSLASLSKPLVKISTGNIGFLDSPHFKGILYPKDRAVQITRATHRLHGMVRGKPTFLLSPRAGLYYLLSGLKNSTPYDYPLVTAFGLKGEEEVISLLAQGKIAYVCMDLDRPQELRSARLEDYIKSNLRLVEDLEICKLYQAPLR